MSPEPERERSEAARFLGSVSPAEKERLTRDALAAAKPWVLTQYERHREARPDLARHFLQVIVEQHVEALLARDPALYPSSKPGAP